MRKIQIAISSDLCIRLAWNLTGGCGQQQRLRGWSCVVVKQFQDGGRPPFWKSICRHNISVKHNPIFMKLCTHQQILNWMNVTWSKMKKLYSTDAEFERTYCLLLLLQRHCGACRRKWRLTDTGLCPRGKTQTMSHIVKSCPLTKLNGGLYRLHSADEDAVSWLTSYGSWHAYEKKKKIITVIFITGNVRD